MTTYPQPPGELDALVHGARPYTLRSRLLTALAADRERAADPPEDSAQRVHRRLRLLADNLPPVGELFRDPEQLAVLSECVALADPPLYMAVVNHYVLCLGSVVTLADDPAALGRPWQALATGRTKGVFLVTEVGDASSHLGIRTTARFDPQTRSSCSTHRWWARRSSPASGVPACRRAPWCAPGWWSTGPHAGCSRSWWSSPTPTARDPACR